MFRPLLAKTTPVGLAGALLLAAGSTALASETDSLATPITGAAVQELWPVEVELEIVPMGRSDKHARAPMTPRKVVVPDGHKVHFSSVVQTTKGTRRFTLEVVARQHPDTVELEWDLHVAEAGYRPLSWSGYLLHRLQLGPDLKLDDERLKIARSDIVSTRGEPHVESVSIDGEVYEIRIFARSLRG